MSGSEVQVDVAVLGGGVMGLWLADQLLRHEYSVALFETKDLGGGQTGHSHAYIHRGHLYNERDLLDQLRDVWRVWEQYLDTENGRQVTRVDVPTRFAFHDSGTAKKKYDFWRSENLKVEKDRITHWMAHAGVRECYRTTETCVEVPSLARFLARDRAHVRKIERVVDFETNRDGIVALTVEALGGQTLRVETGFVVICAGAGNAALMEQLPFEAPAPVVRDAYMLTLERREDPGLPWFAGVFPDRDGLFIVPRQGDRGTVWLLSNFYHGQDPSVWLDQALPGVAKVLVSLEQDRNDYLWGMYKAPKAEPGGREAPGVGQGFGVELKDKRNVRVVWPVKLTLAPKVSDYLIKDVMVPILRHTPPAAPIQQQSAWQHFSGPPGFAQERWTTTPRVDWPTFKRDHGVTVW